MRPVRDATNSRSFRSLELDRLRVVIRALARGGQRGQRVGGMGPGFFFPTNSVAFARAERICAGCPVAAECLATALEDPSLHGIWAGTSTAERQYLRSEEGLGWG